MTTAKQNIISMVLGIVFVLLILFLVLQYPCPTKIQANVFQIVLAISAGACAAVIPGFFNFKYQSLVKAGGGLGIFALVYLVNPAGISEGDNCNCNRIFNGRVFMNNQPAKKVSVRCLELKSQAETDEDGEFSFQTCRADERATYSFNLSYGAYKKYLKPAKINWKKCELIFDTTTTIIAPRLNSTSYTINNIPDTSIRYGGGSYCNYLLKLEGIVFYLGMDMAAKKIHSANVSFKAHEETLNNCAFSGIAMNTHFYNMSNSQFKNNEITITFTPTELNSPNCDLIFTGTIQKNIITGALFLKRTDMPEPSLSFEQVIPVRYLVQK
jgi:hypothetical protein